METLVACQYWNSIFFSLWGTALICSLSKNSCSHFSWRKSYLKLKTVSHGGNFWEYMADESRKFCVTKINKQETMHKIRVNSSWIEFTIYMIYPFFISAAMLNVKPLNSYLLTVCSVVKVGRRIRWHYTTTILRLRISARLTRYRNCKFHNGCRTISHFYPCVCC